MSDAVMFSPPGGQTYTVLRTIEVDSYETGPAATSLATLHQRQGGFTQAELAAALNKQPPPVGDKFQGTARKAAKLSVAIATTEPFNDVRALVASLVADAAMVAHKPAISVLATSARVSEENRNVRVKGFLYASSREADNDFHLIVGLDPSASQETYMTMEVSGLPEGADPALKRLKPPRDAFEAFFKNQLPQMTYDYYHPPIPVVVEGSLFFDMSHSSGPHPGPPSLQSHMPTIWEVHPVTAITLGP